MKGHCHVSLERQLVSLTIPCIDSRRQVAGYLHAFTLFTSSEHWQDIFTQASVKTRSENAVYKHICTLDKIQCIFSFQHLYALIKPSIRCRRKVSVRLATA